MAIPVILKGDTSAKITLSADAGWDYSGCVLRLAFNGVVREFADIVAGGSFALEFTADETAGMPLGTAKVEMSLRNAAGEVRTMPWAKIKVTDAPGEVYGGGIVIDPSQLDVEDATAGDSLGAVKSKLNAVLAFLRGGAAALAVVFALPVLAEVVPLYTTLNDMPGDAPLMTNAEAYVEAKMVEATNGLVRTESDPTVPAWAKAATKPSYTASEVGAATAGDVASATNALAAKIVAPDIIATNLVKTVISNSLYNLSYDETLGVTWRKTAEGGAFYERCYTNVNLIGVSP